MRDFIFGALLVVAAACIVIAGAHLHPAVAWYVAGLLIAALSWLFLGGDTADAEPTAADEADGPFPGVVE